VHREVVRGRLKKGRRDRSYARGDVVRRKMSCLAPKREPRVKDKVVGLKGERNGRGGGEVVGGGKERGGEGRPEHLQSVFSR
jgi:hypothetical protein